MELFPQVGGWYFDRVPKKITDGTQFIALSAKVRKVEGIGLGDNDL